MSLNNIDNTKNDNISDIEKYPYEEYALLIDTLKNEILNRVKVSDNILNLLLTGFFSGLHILLEDYPGTGKTTLAKTLINTIDTEDDQSYNFKRIQFTPDLLPYDIIGNEIFSREKEQFIFIKGPVFSGILLADEINRGNPKIQSALLEAMGENQVTAFGKTYKLHELFFVIATQNPLEVEGTFPIPVSSLDRFGMCFSLGYPQKDQQKAILSQNLIDFNPSIIKKTIKISQIIEIRKFIKNIYIDEKLIDIINLIGIKSREDHNFTHGFSVRALLHLLNATKAYAFIARKGDFCIDKDIKDVFVSVISHRLHSSKEKEYLPEFLENIFSERLL